MKFDGVGMTSSCHFNSWRDTPPIPATQRRFNKIEYVAKKVHDDLLSVSVISEDLYGDTKVSRPVKLKGRGSQANQNFETVMNWGDAGGRR